MDASIILKSQADALVQILAADDYDGATVALEALYRDTLQSINEAQFQKYYSTRRYTEALSCAMKIIELMPDKSLGYLHAGRCLAAQSSLPQAIAMYGQGLAHNENDEVLRISMQKAQEKLDRPVMDWIHLLPYDVVCNIFAYLTFDERCICLDVCTPWRILLSNCTPLWTLLEFDSQTRNILPCIGKHVTRVAFSRMPAEKMLPILHTMVDRDCTNVKSLKLLECDISTDQLAQCMSRICQNTLELEIRGHLQPLSLQPLLDSCPNVSRLLIRQSQGQHSKDDELDLFRLTRVTHLYLHHDKPIDHMLRHCPLLRSIALEKRKYNDIKSCIALCPDLQYFHHNNGLSIDGDDTIYHSPGLRHLSIGISVVGDDERACVKQVIEQHGDTLLSLKIEAQKGDRRNWSGVFGGPLPRRLQTVDLSAELESTLIPLLQHSEQTLTSVTFKSMLCVEDHVTDALLRLPQLNTLCILDCINLTENGMLRLVSHISVKHLEIAGYSFYMTDSVLETLAKNTSIKVLKLSWCGLGSARRMQALVKSMVTSRSKIEQLSFTRSSVHADTLDALGDLTHLNRVRLSMCTNVTDLGVKHLVNKRKKPFGLEISECNLLSPEFVDYAKAKLGNGFQYSKG
ncbi:hypothetical protein BJV82DRAFT_668340 [Fennellomyces sp. T-0311]|nr:hypothetical protein BJV82DRAFT_668340 [Fennellomyces sp. T-0311]